MNIIKGKTIEYSLSEEGNRWSSQVRMRNQPRIFH